MKPALGEMVRLKATLKGTPEDGEAIFVVSWLEDLDEIKGAENLDLRDRTISQCKIWNNLKTQISSNKAKVEADSTAAYDSWKDNAAKEIYACIRAEYKFICDLGCKKISSRVGTRGIDHLFVGKKGKYYIVESKTISDLSCVSSAITKRDPNVVLSRLGEGRQIEGKDEGIVSAFQMSQPWVLHCLNELYYKSSGEARKVIKEVRANIRNKKSPYRILNIYGGLDWNADGAWEELKRNATKISSKFKGLSKEDKEAGKEPERSGREDLLLLDGKWRTADPNKGLYYLLPGKYNLRARAEQWVIKKAKAQTVVFADKPYKNEEFFLLDKVPKEILKKFASRRGFGIANAMKKLDKPLRQALESARNKLIGRVG